MKISSILLVDEIESSLPFWVDRIGFTNVGEVPHEGKIGFVILTKDGTELMLQSHASASADHAALGGFAKESKAALYIEVDDFADVVKRLEGYPVALAVRETFYGMREIGVFAPGGHLVVFSAKIL